jgi:hypothetical protein
MDESLTMRMQYLGVLSLMAEMSVHLREGSESDDFRGNIEQALTDAQKVVPRLRWRRVLNSFEVDLADEGEA